MTICGMSIHLRWSSSLALMSLLAVASCTEQAPTQHQPHTKVSSYAISRAKTTPIVGLDHALVAANARQRLRGYFGARGVHVVPAREANRVHGWSLALGFAGIGRGGAKQTAAPVAPASVATRVEYRREGLTEWYENGARGLEQGFDIAKRPVGDGPLELDIAIDGDLRATKASDDTVIMQSRAGQQVLRYAGLDVTDAHGRHVPAWFDVHGRRVAIVVDDHEAAYPLVVDPWLQRVELKASDAASHDQFGTSVAVSGDVAIVGANRNDDAGTDSGSAYIYERDQGGRENWGEVKKLVASDASSSDQFGYAVAISGEVAVVGAPNNASGAVYVFARDEGGSDNWGEVKELVASDAASGDQFGFSVAIDGDTVVVGAFGNSDAGHHSGSAYVFARNQGGSDNWGEVKKLTAGDAAFGDQFGYSVAVSGDVVVVGATAVRVGGFPEGAVYIFERNQGGSDNWGQVKKRLASDAGSFDSFGRSVAVIGDVVVVGSVYADGTRGAAYVFGRDEGGSDNWGQIKKLTASDRATGDQFGSSVAIDGKLAVIGAKEESSVRGAAYVFGQDEGGSDNWGQIKKLTASDAAANAFFGASVSFSSGTAVVGAWGDADTGTNSGSAYIFLENTPPAAGADTATVAEDASTSVDVLANDTDADGDTLTVSMATPPGHGSATVNTDGTITYAPDADYNGSDSFDYQVDDGNGGTDTATVTVTVTPVNDAPVFVDPTPADHATLSVVEGDTLSVTLAATDVDADTLSFEVTGLPQGASVDATNQNVSWTPTWQDAGTYQLTLSVSDGELGDERAITVEVSFVDDDADGLPDTRERELGLDPGTGDSDGDGIADVDEVGSDLQNPADTDGDGTIDALDDDADGDGISDADEAGDDDLATPPVDTDGDGTPDYLDTDSDDDGIDDDQDNCRLVQNADQADLDHDGRGDVCDDDTDGDGVADDVEEANGLDPTMADTDGDHISDGDEFGDDAQTGVDTDGDGTIDALDDDSDGDGVSDADESGFDARNVPVDVDGDGTPDPDKLNADATASVPLDTDGDGTPNFRDTDSDDDGVEDGQDNCVLVQNADQTDTDQDGVGDVCEDDTDGDGALDVDDNCPMVKNPDQFDNDGDHKGDVCDADDDNDTIADTDDNCPMAANTDQVDTDQDGKGDACDDDIDQDGVANADDACPLQAAQTDDGCPTQKLTSANDSGCGCSSTAAPSNALSMLLVLIGLVALRFGRKDPKAPLTHNRNS